MGSCSFYASQEDLLYYYSGTSTVLLEDQLYHRKTNCCVGRSTVLLENQLYYWKIYCNAGRSMVLIEDYLYWRQSTGLDGNYQSRKITTRRWLHKYVGAECGASSFTWYLYQICNTDVHLSVSPFYPTALKGSGVLSSPGRVGVRQGRQALLTLSCPQFFTDHFQTWQGHLLP